MVPETTVHSVGGSSSTTGAKFSASTCFGSTDGRIGGSMKVLIMSSKALKTVAANDGGGVGCFVETRIVLGGYGEGIGLLLEG